MECFLLKRQDHGSNSKQYIYLYKLRTHVQQNNKINKNNQ